MRLPFALLFLALPVLLFVACRTESSFAQNTRIRALVNDDVITELDIERKAGIVLLSSNFPNLASSQLRAEALRLLIDDYLRLQAAGSEGVSVLESEIEAQIAGLRARNGVSEQQLKEVLSARNTDRAMLSLGLRAVLGWRQVLERRFGALARASDSEIDAEIERLRALAGQNYYRLGEILLSISSRSEEEEHYARAVSLIDSLRSGADFDELARLFSDSVSSGRGGDTGWVAAGQLETPILQAVMSLQTGEVFPNPIRTRAGWMIVFLHSLRAPDYGRSQLRLMRLDFAGSPEGRESALSASKRRLECGAAPHSYGAIRAVMLPELLASELEEGVRRSLADKSIGESIMAGTQREAQQKDTPVSILVLCARALESWEPPPRERVALVLFENRLGALGRQYLNDLRLAAIIEHRPAPQQAQTINGGGE